MKAKLNNKSNIKKILLGLVLAWVATLVMAAIAAWLISKGTIPMNGQGIIGYGVCFCGSIICAISSSAGAQKRGMMALLSGAIYYISLFIIGLLMTEKLSVKLLIQLPVILAGSFIGAMCSRRKRRGVPRIK